VVQSNWIGTTPDGLTDLGASGSQVSFARSFAPSNNLIGGTNPGEGNVIAFGKPGNFGAAGEGILVDGLGTGNRLLGNSIHDNQAIGIDLGAGGATANDAGDADTGVNNLQNFPVITGYTRLANSTQISFTLNSAANTTYRLEFFNDENTGK